MMGDYEAEDSQLDPVGTVLVPPEDPRVDDQTEEDDEHEPFHYDISVSSKDPLVDGLVRRLGQRDIEIPQFQRGYIWTRRQADRFIESLLLGLPVPGIFLAETPGTSRQLVLDGQQRLRTLEYFYEGVISGREYALQHVEDQFVGKTYKTLDRDSRLRLDNTSINATIVRQNEPADDQSSIFLIFERINSGGTSLSPQEIRFALQQGPFAVLLRSLNMTTKAWRLIYGPPSIRLKDEELVLRFLALYFGEQSYKPPMKLFLNNFMGSNRGFEKVSEEDLGAAFIPTIRVIQETLGRGAFRPKTNINAAVFDAVMVGVARRLERGPIKGGSALTEAYFALLQDEQFGLYTSRATADLTRVSGRLGLATEAFSAIP